MTKQRGGTLEDSNANRKWQGTKLRNETMIIGPINHHPNHSLVGRIMNHSLGS